MPMIRFGASPSSPTPRPPAEQFRLVRRLEEWGFESIWAGDHVSFHNPIFESLTLLATYVGITSRIKLGTAVYLLALRSPAVAAKVTGTLDALSGGRLIFGVGVGGENPKEFEVCGVPHRERGARVTEAIDVVRTLWRDTPASFQGRFSRFDGVSLDPKPVQRPGPPIWIGGRSDAALVRAARQGDGWISYVVHAERYAQSVARIREEAGRAGRPLDGDGFVNAHLAFVTIGDDYEKARDTWVRLLSKRYAQDFGPLAKKYGIIGTAAQCAEQLARFIDAGCACFVMNPICDNENTDRQFEQIAAEILPRFAAK
ncbi:MAG TPA: LLM class flavin-dependent oxidoreductase [Candidatus Methylomirabilis sp.]|nr:LLM class flavin-dependent oxidoreductase [Candidatus Methylomirabilis sp.]